LPYRAGPDLRQGRRRIGTVDVSRPPVGTDWVHEIRHDGYRIIVRRDSPTVRLYSRNAYDWTARLTAIAAAAELIKAKSFTIDGEAVVVGPDGWSGSRSCPVVRPLRSGSRP
jgi:ATP-dependent DNA ligase